MLYVYNVIDFIVHIKTGDIYKYMAKDVETRFDTSNYELNRPLQNVLGLIKDELGGKTIKKLLD